MSLQVIEGTWEEIKSREAELIGRRLRVTIIRQTAARQKPSGRAKRGTASEKPKKLQGWGMLAGILSTEDYLQEKRGDTLREDRDLR